MCSRWRGNDINSEKQQGETFQGYGKGEICSRAISPQHQEAASGGGRHYKEASGK